jgi:hypothetical protein
MGETLQSKMRRLTPYVRGALRSVEAGGRHYEILYIHQVPYRLPSTYCISPKLTLRHHFGWLENGFTGVRRLEG